ncbi:cyclopropane-fatty-acyl-phospholipid synthase [Ramaria rubella]|nr:cyclopropane-fatty-acyl-phospholipid synthase [Ramaria rubella]
MSIYSTQLLQTPATHRTSVTGLFDSVWNTVAGSVAALTSASFPSLAQSIVVRALKQIEHGELRIVTPTEVLTFGGGGLSPELKVELRVRRQAFWIQVLLFKDMGFAEAFMYGDVDCDDVSTFLRVRAVTSKDVYLFIANRQNIKIDSLASSIFSAPRFLTSARFLADLTNSRANASAHYDIGNTMFSTFLSEDMNYSSAIFKDFTEDIRPGAQDLESLEDAQLRKMRHIIARADIRKGHRVLEIGSGWGALSILAVQTTGCTVDTLTLSSEQHELATKRIEAAGLSDKITVHLMDYRDCKLRSEWKHHFDRFVSVEMIENVGKDFLETFWNVVDWALKTDDAVGCVQVISIPEARVPEYDRGVDFIQKWVSYTAYFSYKLKFFPGGYIPSCNLLISAITNGSGGRLTMDSASNIGPHYARTLREWKRKFSASFNSIIAPALRGKYQLSDKDLEIFRRKWICTDYCESGFATRLLGDHIISFTREGNVALGCTWDGYEKE